MPGEIPLFHGAFGAKLSCRPRKAATGEALRREARRARSARRALAV